MDVPLIITTALLGLLAVAVVWLALALRRQSSDPSLRLQSLVENLKAELLSKQMQGLVSLRESLDSANRGLNERLAEGASTIDRRLAVIADIENKLGSLQQQTTHLEQIGKNIQALSELLKPPTIRGGLGEMLLENLLSQILPSALYTMQFSFPDGRRVDAVIRLGDRLLPVDSKFPLDPFQRMLSAGETDTPSRDFARAIKTQIDSIAAKYIRPQQNTTDFALMYIPSESVYNCLISDNFADSFTYALSHRVIPSSPGHLYAFLASIAAIYTEAGLAGNTRRLTAVLNALRASVARLEQLHSRIAGSTRIVGLNLDKARAETDDMKKQLDSLLEPVAAGDHLPEKDTECPPKNMI